MTAKDRRVAPRSEVTGPTVRRRLFSTLVLTILCGCGGGNSNRADVAFVINKNSGQIDVCQLMDGSVDFTSCELASTSTLSQPIDMVMSGHSALISVEDGIEKCTRSGNQLVSCGLAIDDSGFPVGLTLANQILFVADYSTKAIASYSAANLDPVGSKSVPTSPTDVVFDQGFGYIVTQDAAGSVVLACNSDLADCAPVYNPPVRALLAMTIYNGVAFLTDANGNNVISCDVGGDGSLSSCGVQGDATIFNYPYGITIRNDVAYIPNRAEGSITVCDVSGKDLLDCNKVTNDLFDGPTWVIFD